MTSLLQQPEFRY